MARPATDIRERLVEAARHHFLAQGVDGASLRAIAKDARTGIGMIYYHFKTKDELFLAVVEHMYEGLFPDLQEALDPALPVRERIERVFERFGRLSAEEVVTVRIVIREALVSAERLSRVLERFQRGHLPLMLQLLMDGRKSGELKSDQPPLATLMGFVTLSLFAQVMRSRMPTDMLPFDAGAPHVLADALCELFLHGAAGPKLDGV